MIQALEFYAGIGGLHCALNRSGIDASVLKAFDHDGICCDVYTANFGPGIIERTDISQLSLARLLSYNAELWLLSPSCQPYTVLNPSKKDVHDPRAESFLHLITTLLPQLAACNRAPSYILLENVAGFELSTGRQILLTTLRNAQYDIQEFLLSPIQFGIPNSRLRYYLLAKHLSTFSTPLPESPGLLQTSLPSYPDVERPTPIAVYLEQDDTTIVHSHAIPDHILKRWGKVFDIVLPSSTRTCCFTRGYTQLIQGSGSIVQMNEDLDTVNVFEEFAVTQDISLLYPLQLRYFTPTELLRLHHFLPLNGNTEPYHWPASVSERTKYRLIGNSINVYVVSILLQHLLS